MHKDYKRIVLLTISYLFAFTSLVGLIIYLVNNGLILKNETTSISLDITLISGSFFLIIKGIADRIQSYKVPVSKRHTWWVYGNVEIVGGILLFISGIISIVINIIG